MVNYNRETLVKMYLQAYCREETILLDLDNIVCRIFSPTIKQIMNKEYDIEDPFYTSFESNFGFCLHITNKFSLDSLVFYDKKNKNPHLQIQKFDI